MEVCAVCYDPISLLNKAVVNNCLHVFCVDCIHKWVTVQRSCPLCKQELNSFQHTFKEDGSFSEEYPPLPKEEVLGTQPVEEQLQCLDHSYFMGEVMALLQSAEQTHRRLWACKQSPIGVSVLEQQQLAMVEEVCLGLRNHKRKLQGMLQFESHAMLQDLYRLQSILQEIEIMSYRQDNVTLTPTRSPGRYSADDAWEGNVSDDEDLAEELAVTLSLSLNEKKQKKKRVAKGKFTKRIAQNGDQKF